MTEDEAKAWLRALRKEQGYTQKELAELVDRNSRTILDAEKPGAGWPGGFTLLRMLQVLGALKDFPGEADSPLARLEATVSRTGSATEASLHELAERLRAVETALEPRDGSATAGRP